TELDHLRVGHEIERDEIGPAFLDRRAVAAERLVQLSDARLERSRGMTDHLVHVRQEIRRQHAVRLVPLDLLGVVRELLCRGATPASTETLITRTRMSVT